jgi:hypothetical protein
LIIGLHSALTFAVSRTQTQVAKRGPEVGDTPGRTLLQSEPRGISISAVHFEQSAHHCPAWCISACQRVFVVRGGVEPPTFRFSGGRSYRLSYLTLAIQRKDSNRSGPDGI